MREITKSLKYFMDFKYMYDARIIIKLFDSIIWLNFFDAVTTYIGLKYFSTIVETNSLITTHISIIGLEMVMVIKILGGILLMLFLKKRFPFKKHLKLDKILIFNIYFPINIILCYTIFNNIIVILQHSQIIP